MIVKKSSFNIFKFFWMIQFMLCACLAVSATAAQSMQINRVAAVVNGEMITLYGLQRQAMQEIMRNGITGNDAQSAQQREDIIRRTLDNMVMDILIRQEAERFQVKVEDSEIENEVRMIAQNNRLSMEELTRKLAAEGGSMDELKGDIRNNILRQRMIGLMVARRAEVTPDDIEKYYNENIRRYSTENSVELSMIAFGPGADAEAVRAELIAGGTSFADSAAKFSTLPNAALGGQLGDIPWKDLNPVWRKALEGVEAGGISSVIYGDSGSVLLRVDALIPGTSKSLAEVSDEIAAQLREPKLLERFAEYSAQLRDKAVVDIRI